ncbi:MAG TPA: alpha/beta hydrolase [Polaromonas sp.]|uniref:alpha/beta hydrolase n=1 Tax=Polaromonas sp. TaxID=1869339 RepID=UPI002D5AFEBD|nr:alpha/beta hydrolase [Polaromonas sp.]HYW56976.1 alpha/beta hydrolase [Polaromonas sp.]
MSTSPHLRSPTALPARCWEDRQIPVGAPGVEKLLNVRIYGRPQRGKVLPLILHFHGGAFVAGKLENGTCVASLLAATGAVVVSLEYPLAPTHPFPDAVEAGYAALVWAGKFRRKLAGHQAPLFVAGEEAGGNIAAAVSLMARDRGEPPPAGQILFSPMLDPCLGTASLRGAAAGPVGCMWADGWHHYLPRPEDATHPYAAPGASLRLAGLPPTLLITAEDDPLRDETLAYASRLRASGVSVHALVLSVSTGWPCSYHSPSCEEAAWMPEVREQLSQFLSNIARAKGSGRGEAA